MPGIKIDGFIELQKDITEEEFSKKFFRFLESEGWSFGGGTEFVEEGDEL